MFCSKTLFWKTWTEFVYSSDSCVFPEECFRMNEISETFNARCPQVWQDGPSNIFSNVLLLCNWLELMM